jgi:hypothetical protein
MVLLSYSGQRTVTQDQTQIAHNLLDKLLSLHAADSPVTVDTGQIRPQADSLLLVVSLSAKADMNTLQAVQDELATELVGLNIEPDVEAAKANIQISG